MDAVVVVFEWTGLTQVSVPGPALGIRRIPRPPAVGWPAATVIDRDRVADRTAQQLPNRLTGKLPEDVPQREVYGRNGPQLASFDAESRAALVQKPPMAFDRGGIRAKQSPSHPIV